MTAGEGLAVLEAQVAWLTGGRDREGRPVLTAIVNWDTCPKVGDQLDLSLRHLASIFSQETRRRGLTLLVDARKCPWRSARLISRVAGLSLGSDLASLIVIRPDAFWDKQRVDCTKALKEGEPIYIPISRLHKFIDSSQLTEEFGGTWAYNHSQWTHNRKCIEVFTREANLVQNDLIGFQQRLREFTAGDRVSTSTDPISFSKLTYDNNRIVAQKIYQKGRELINRIEKSEKEYQERNEGQSPPQDVIDTRENLKKLLENLLKELCAVDEAWCELQKKFLDAREINGLEEGVARVTRWILGPAENMLNSQQQVGYDVPSSEELRSEHEALELQCRDTYGQYAELLHKIDTLPQLNIKIPEDLKSQRDFMDFVCRSFASRLERRRNILITCLRFYRLVTEYFEKTSEVFESQVLYTDAGSLESADCSLQELQDSQTSIDYLAKELVKEGEKLSDLLSMPVKDALGRDIDVNYESDIVNVQEILQATLSRKQLFSDSVDLQKLTLEQVTHIHVYEKDATQAVQWLKDLFKVLIKDIHVGCSVYEIQSMKEQLQTFQETVKGTYEYGWQLLTAALALRQSCKLQDEIALELQENLQDTWRLLQMVTQELMTRLRVCAVFHRTVEEHCSQLRDLICTVTALCNLEDVPRRRSKIRRCLQTRERLLLEVGRMVRLGRLLRTRLKEPVYSDSQSRLDSCATSVEAISDRLTEVTNLAEKLDVALCAAQAGGDSPSTVTPNIKKILDGTASSAPEQWYNSLKTASKTPNTSNDSKSEDEFVTASECTCTPPSRSSSFQTASEGGAVSPWWEMDPSSDTDDKAKAVPQPQQPVDRRQEATSDVVVREETEKTTLKISSGREGLSTYLLETSSSLLRPDMNVTGTNPVEDGSSEDSRTSEIVRQLSQIVTNNEEAGKDVDTSSQYSSELLNREASHTKSLSVDTDNTDISLPRFSAAAPPVPKLNGVKKSQQEDEEAAYRKEIQRYAPDENSKIYIIDTSTPSPKSQRYLETSFDLYQEPRDLETQIHEVRRPGASFDTRRHFTDLQDRKYIDVDVRNKRPLMTFNLHDLTEIQTTAAHEYRERQTIDYDLKERKCLMTLNLGHIGSRRPVTTIHMRESGDYKNLETLSHERPVPMIDLQNSYAGNSSDYCPSQLKRMAIQGIF